MFKAEKRVKPQTELRRWKAVGGGGSAEGGEQELEDTPAHFVSLNCIFNNWNERSC